MATTDNQGITLQKRAEQRKTILSLASLTTEMETGIRRGSFQNLSSESKRWIKRIQTKEQVTGAEGVLNAALDWHERAEKLYLRRLRENSANSLSCFVEFMTPDEPPADHHEFMCDHLEAIERRDIMRAAFSMPPGHAKTKFCSRYFSAWYLGRNPRHRYLQGGHSQSFSENEFGKPTRDIIADNRFREVFPDVSLHPRSSAAGNWKLSNGRGGYVTKGVGQKLAGYRGHCGGVDDPFGSREDAESPIIRERVKTWFFADFRTRFLPFSPIFIVATRWHEDDLIGYVETLNRDKRGIPWNIINLNGVIENDTEAAVDPMGRDIGETLWPGFYSYDILMELKDTLPSTDWWALYKGKPRPVDGNVLKATWLHRYASLPRNQYDGNGRLTTVQIKRVTVSVDTANKTTERSAYTVVTVWIEGVDGRHYLADVRRKKVEFAALINFIEEPARQWKASAILVEDKGNGTAYIQQRAGKAPCPIITITPEAEGSKEFRFDGVTTMFEAGLVLFPVNAVWMADYEAELLQFPNSTYKDQVDSTSQYLTWCKHRTGYGTKKANRGRGPARRTRSGRPGLQPSGRRAAA